MLKREFLFLLLTVYLGNPSATQAQDPTSESTVKKPIRVAVTMA